MLPQPTEEGPRQASVLLIINTGLRLDHMRWAKQAFLATAMPALFGCVLRIACCVWQAA